MNLRCLSRAACACGPSTLHMNGKCPDCGHVSYSVAKPVERFTYYRNKPDQARAQKNAAKARAAKQASQSRRDLPSQ